MGRPISVDRKVRTRAAPCTALACCSQSISVFWDAASKPRMVSLASGCRASGPASASAAQAIRSFFRKFNSISPQTSLRRADKTLKSILHGSLLTQTGSHSAGARRRTQSILRQLWRASVTRRLLFRGQRGLLAGTEMCTVQFQVRSSLRLSRKTLLNTWLQA